ncbi:MAG TPA: hypothetical protein VMX17_16925 [Candidatus Glassbacteria bacterium]|nr:hypothetical protein [Candidatus Glassbacteria bacterium]
MSLKININKDDFSEILVKSISRKYKLRLRDISQSSIKCIIGDQKETVEFDSILLEINKQDNETINTDKS